MANVSVSQAPPAGCRAPHCVTAMGLDRAAHGSSHVPSFSRPPAPLPKSNNATQGDPLPRPPGCPCPRKLKGTCYHTTFAFCVLGPGKFWFWLLLQVAESAPLNRGSSTCCLGCKAPVTPFPVRCPFESLARPLSRALKPQQSTLPLLYLVEGGNFPPLQVAHDMLFSLFSFPPALLFAYSLFSLALGFLVSFSSLWISFFFV